MISERLKKALAENESLKTALQDFEIMRERNSHLTKEVDSLNQKLSKIKQEHGDNDSSKGERLRRAENSILELQGEKNRLSVNLHEANAELEQLKKKLESVESSSSETSSEVSRLRNVAQQHSSAVQELAAEKKMTAMLKQKVIEFEDRVLESVKRAETSDNSLLELQHEHQLLRANSKQTSDDLKKAYAENQKLATDVELLRRKVRDSTILESEIEKRCEQIQKENQLLRDRLTRSLEEKTDDAFSMHNALEQERSLSTKLSVDLQQAHLELENTKKLLSDAEGSTDINAQKVKDLNEKYQILEENLKGILRKEAEYIAQIQTLSTALAQSRESSQQFQGLQKQKRQSFEMTIAKEVANLRHDALAWKEQALTMKNDYAKLRHLYEVLEQKDAEVVSICKLVSEGHQEMAETSKLEALEGVQEALKLSTITQKELDEALSKAKQEISELREALDDRDGRVIAGANAQISMLRSELLQLKEEANNLRGTVAAYENAQKNLESESAVLQNLVESTNAQLENVINERSELQKQLLEQKEALEEAKLQLRHSTRSTDSLSAQHRTASEEFEAASSKLRIMTGERDTLSKENKSLRDFNEEIGDQLKQATDENLKLSQKHKHSLAELEHVKGQQMGIQAAALASLREEVSGLMRSRDRNLVVQKELEEQAITLKRENAQLLQKIRDHLSQYEDLQEEGIKNLEQARDRIEQLESSEKALQLQNDESKRQLQESETLRKQHIEQHDKEYLKLSTELSNTVKASRKSLTEHEEELREVLARRADLMEQLRQLRESQHHVDEMTSLLEAAREENVKLESENRTLSEDVFDLRNVEKNLRKKEKTLTLELEDCQESLEKVTRERLHALDKISDLERFFSEQKHEYSVLQRRSMDEITQLEGKVSSLTADLQVAQENARRLEGTVTTQKEEISELQASVNVMTADLHDARESVDASRRVHNRCADSLRRDSSASIVLSNMSPRDIENFAQREIFLPLDRLRDEIRQMELAATRAQHDIESMQAELRGSEERLQEADVVNAELQKNKLLVAELERDNKQLSEALNNVENDLKRAQDQILLLQAEKKDMQRASEDQMATLERALRKAKTDNDRLADECVTLEKEVERVQGRYQEELAKFNLEMKELEAKSNATIAELQESNETKQNRSKQLEEDLANLQDGESLRRLEEQSRQVFFSLAEQVAECKRDSKTIDITLSTMNENYQQIASVVGSDAKTLSSEETILTNQFEAMQSAFKLAQEKISELEEDYVLAEEYYLADIDKSRLQMNEEAERIAEVYEAKLEAMQSTCNRRMASMEQECISRLQQQERTNGERIEVLQATHQVTVDGKQMELDRRGKAMHDLQQDVEKYQKLYKEATKSLQNVEKATKAVEKRLVERIEELERESEDLRGLKERLQSDNMLSEEEANRRKNAMERQEDTIERLEKQLREKTEECANLSDRSQKQIQSLNLEKENLDKLMKHFDSTGKELQKKLEKVTKEAEELRIRNREMESTAALMANESMIKQADEMVATFKTQQLREVDNLKSKSRTLENQLLEYADHMERMKARVKTAEGELRKQKEKSDEELTSMNAIVSKMSEDLNAFKDMADQRTQTLQESQDELRMRDQDFEVLRKQLNISEKSVANLTSENKSLHAELQILRQVTDSANEKQVAKARAMREALDKQLQLVKSSSSSSK